VKASYLIRGTPGHPLHPPLTDATIGAYTTSAALGALGWLGLAESDLAKGWWLALIVGLIVSAPTALAGFADWLQITRGTPLWRTATVHALVNVAATAFFGLAAIAGHIPFHEGRVSGGALLLTLAGFALLALGGWIGGALTYVYGMRVLGLPDEPTRRAVSPFTEATEETEEAAER
jgi:uncharacterized membrane protein